MACEALSRLGLPSAGAGAMGEDVIKEESIEAFKTLKLSIAAAASRSRGVYLHTLYGIARGGKVVIRSNTDIIIHDAKRGLSSLSAGGVNPTLKELPEMKKIIAFVQRAYEGCVDEKSFEEECCKPLYEAEDQWAAEEIAHSSLGNSRSITLVDEGSLSSDDRQIVSYYVEVIRILALFDSIYRPLQVSKSLTLPYVYSEGPNPFYNQTISYDGIGKDGDYSYLYTPLGQILIRGIACDKSNEDGEYIGKSSTYRLFSIQKGENGLRFLGRDSLGRELKPVVLKRSEDYIPYETAKMAWHRLRNLIFYKASQSEGLGVLLHAGRAAVLTPKDVK